jgi:hypothetical protein
MKLAGSSLRYSANLQRNNTARVSAIQHEDGSAAVGWSAGVQHGDWSAA